mgnify:CR=1 FL=1|tara:strand:+ start:1569 stop:2075 length:507 start_codon:yes stop_codon:yes gene_type:complete
MANNYSDYTIIRVTPTLSTDAYATGDVLFTATEIPNAVRGNGGCAKLLSCYIIDQDRDTYDVDLHFTEKNTALGTINQTANISDSDFEAIGYCGSFYFQTDVGHVSNIDNIRLIKSQALTGAGESPESFLIQAEAGSSSVYVQGIIKDGTPTFAATDDIDIVLHIQYK